ncbi:hypothetical protein [Magnetospirillum sp. 15-1]|uniref:hypothetical protein n=1 Tax=Magnetospirillum sp. 15-1 TaxID=1979370 RepID=UPI0011449B07|nr:hypothetical protein [Magnetospirillum sp. 15-1]
MYELSKISPDAFAYLVEADVVTDDASSQLPYLSGLIEYYRACTAGVDEDWADEFQDDFAGAARLISELNSSDFEYVRGLVRGFVIVNGRSSHTAMAIWDRYIATLRQNASQS